MKKTTIAVSAIAAIVLTATVTLTAEARTHPGRGHQKHPQPTPTPLSTPPPTPTPAATPLPTPTPIWSGTLPNFSHVFLIVMENEESTGIMGNNAAAYINALATGHGLATQYFAVSHPSLPNYLALTAGSTFGIASDCTGCYVNATNIADQVESSGRSWKGYLESMPSSCYVGDAYPYMQKHNPFIYYNDVRTNPARCAEHVVPFTQLSTDLVNGTVPNLVWITPNMCNDMHDCSIATGDAWLANVVPGILASSAFQNGGVLFITWDEGESSAGCCGNATGGQVATLVIAPNGIAASVVLGTGLATVVIAAPAAASPSPTTKQRPAAKDAFGGIVTAINQTQVTVKNAKQGSKTFARQDSTVVVKGRNEKSSWSEIEINSHVLVRYETRDGKLYAK